MNIITDQIKKGRKFGQVLEGAREVFMADGFAGASVDNIAKSAGVSKATLYSYFPDKRRLFIEVAQSECLRHQDQAAAHIDMTAPAAQVLHAAATRMIGFVTSKFGQQMFRICVAEADRFPELGHEFYRSGPQMVCDTLVGYFKQAVAKNELDIDDLSLAAHQFAELCKSELFPKMIFGIQTEFSKAEIDRVAKGAVEMFLARYGVKG